MIYNASRKVPHQPTTLDVRTPNVPTHYIGKVALNDNLSIRLLVLKHSYEPMADGDARMAIQAANLAAERGLQIKDIGNYNINRNGKRYVSSAKMDLPELKKFVSEQMKIDAVPGDTLVIFTIGHGFGGGGLDNLGQRTGVMEALAAAAAENDQETVWWQLSCHACAGLPAINTLPADQQSLFSIVASSNASDVSAAYVQGKHMEKVFLAMAERSREIDPDGNDEITQNELRNFMNEHVSRGRGDLIFAASPNEVMFGFGGWANKIPIIDHNGQQRTYPRNYIPVPGRSV
jgi:hypothetical protein